MPGQVIGKEMPLGYPGSTARMPDFIIMARMVNAESAPIPFGSPVILNEDNTYSAFGAIGTAEDFGGIAIREVKQATSYLNQNEVAYQPSQICDVLERGNIVVKCGKGTPKAGRKVHIRTAENEIYPGSFIGDFEAEEDTGKTVALSGVVWTTGKMDGNRSCEITLKNRV